MNVEVDFINFCPTEDEVHFLNLKKKVLWDLSHELNYIYLGVEKGEKSNFYISLSASGAYGDISCVWNGKGLYNCLNRIVSEYFKKSSIQESYGGVFFSFNNAIAN